MMPERRTLPTGAAEMIREAVASEQAATRRRVLVSNAVLRGAGIEGDLSEWTLRDDGSGGMMATRANGDGIR